MPVACGARLRCSATRACSRAQLRERVVDFVSALALASSLRPRRLCLLRLCSCCVGGSPAHWRVYVAALGLALASAASAVACLCLCLLLRLCSCGGGGSPAHSRVSVAALGLALASALVTAPSPLASPTPSRLWGAVALLCHAGV